jgi:hypothetical protein
MRLLNFRRINIHPLTMRIASPLLGKAAFVELGLNYYVRYNTLSQPIGTQKKHHGYHGYHVNTLVENSDLSPILAPYPMKKDPSPIQFECPT